MKTRNTRKTIVFQGDSVTDAGRSGSADSFALGSGYVSLLAAKIGVDHAADNYLILNKGVGGDKVVQLFARWRDDVLNIHPQILSILIGVNDSYGEYTPWHNGVAHEKFRRVYTLILDEALADNPDCKLVLCEPFSMPASLIKLGIKVQTPAKAKADLLGKQQIVKSLAEKYGACFVPLQEVFDRAQKKARSVDYWILDGLHPSLSGHELIARQWLDRAGSLL
ncbi:MAG: lysophospholipase [Planctomycetes bacterium]|nr:lysophospholipase [Planctomycetota bacterium]